MRISFGYNRRQVIQALRYHFISRKEIRLMLILINVFAIATLILYIFKKIGPAAFLMGSFMWLLLMVSFWYILPMLVYKRSVTFKHEFSMSFSDSSFSLEHGNGNSKNWQWNSLSNYLESPNFFHLYFDPRSFLLVPKDGCKDSDEVHALRQIIKKNVRKGSVRG
jgi:hypothetical protein